MDRLFRRAGVKAGPLIVLVLVIAATAGFWVWRGSTQGEEKTSWAKPEDTFLLYCAACKKEQNVDTATGKKLKAEGNKVECPICHKMEANWGAAPAGAPPSQGGPAVQMP